MVLNSAVTPSKSGALVAFVSWLYDEGGGAGGLRKDGEELGARVGL